MHLLADLAGVFGVVDTAPCTTDCVHAWGGAESTRPIGDSSPPWMPTKMVGLSGVRQVTGTHALRADGTVWAWGNNTFGQLGNGWASNWAHGGSAVPVPVVGLADVTAIASSGTTAYALREDRTVWAWGNNDRGALGNGTLDGSSVPVQVTGLTDVVAIAAGWSVGFAVRADGTVWAWGFDGGGNLGTGTTADHSTTPIQVVGLAGITTIAAGGGTTYALHADGTVWSWGYNFGGALGHGQPCAPGQDCLSRVPVQVSGLTGVTAIDGGSDHGRALRADGTVWSWGIDHRGQLGDGEWCDLIQGCASHVPVQTIDLTDVTRLGGTYAGGYALRADGTVWSWGSNSVGELGTDAVPLNDIATTPVQVQLPSGVSAISNGASGGYAIVP